MSSCSARGQLGLAGSRDSRRRPGSERTRADRPRRVGYDPAQVELHRLAETLADRASPQRAVVAEQVGLGFDVIGPAPRAPPAANIRLRHSSPADDPATAQTPCKCGFDRIGPAFGRILAADQTVDDDLDLVICGQIERRSIERDGLPVDAERA